MAAGRIIVPNIMPALDINADPVPGAKLYFYLNETTTLTTVYTTSALSVAHANPVVADASGVFPSIFADTALAFSIALTDADGAPIVGLRNRDNVTATTFYGDDVVAECEAAATAAAASAADAAATLAGAVLRYNAKSEIAAATISGNVRVAQTRFYAPNYAAPATMVGGATYVRTSYATITAGSYPAASYVRSVDRLMPDGSTDATNGGYWLLQDEVVTPQKFGAVGNASADDYAAIVAAEAYCAIGGQPLTWPPGVYRCDTGITKAGNVDWLGSGRLTTTIDYRGSGVCINALGTDPARIVCTIAKIGLDGTNAAADAIGVLAGWNMRSTLLDNVRIYKMGKYGIQFDDQNWIVTLRDVLIDSCGWLTTNGSGMYKAGDSTAAGEWNDMTFIGVNIENCGRSGDSTAGGMLILSDSANRGLKMIACDIEGNRGTSQVYITNMADVLFDGIYMETTAGVGESAVRAITLGGCHATFDGGYIRGADSGVNLFGVHISTGAGSFPCRAAFNNTVISGYGTTIAASSGATVYTSQLGQDRIFANLDATPAQWFGDYSPRISARKSTAQTVPTGVFTKVVFDVERYDLTGALASSTFTPGTVGTYDIKAYVTWAAAVASDGLIIAIYLNGSAYRQRTVPAIGTGAQSIPLTADVDISAATDTIEVYVRQTSGVDQDISASPEQTFFSASLIGRKS
jgi:hypothetical protein